MYKLILYREQIFSTKFDRIIFLYSGDHHLRKAYLDHLKTVCTNIEISESLSLDLLDLYSDSKPKFLLLDDMQETIFNSSAYMRLMTRFSHHVFTFFRYLPGKKSFVCVTLIVNLTFDFDQ